MASRNRYVFDTPALNYNFSSIDNDRNKIKPIQINFPNYQLQGLLKSHCNPIRFKVMKKKLIIWKYAENQLQIIASIIKAVQSCKTEPIHFTEALPWHCLEINSLEKNIVNENFNKLNDSFLYDPTKRNIICKLFLKNLNFFELAKLQRVSTQFLEPIYEHLYEKYSVKKPKLFEYFDLKEFLMEIDENYNLNPITIYELRFIFKHFGHHMKDINIQLEFLKINVILNNINTIGIINTISGIIEKFTEKDELQSVFIYKIKIKDKTMNHLIKLTENTAETPLNFADENLLKPAKYVNFKEIMQCYDMQTNPKLINYDCFFYLFIRKNVPELKFLTDYPHLEIERMFMIDFLNNITLERFDIQCQNDSRDNNCEDLINALLKNSRNTLKSIQITSCRSQNIFRLLNKFKNLEEITIVNCQIDDMHCLKLLKLPNLRVLKMPKYICINDSLCWEVYQQNKCLEYFDISESNINGKFLKAVNLVHSSCKLIIDITGSRAAYLYNRQEISITNEKLIVRNKTFHYYDQSERNEILQNLNNDVDRDSSDFYSTTLSYQLPKSFIHKLSLYLGSLNLNLRDIFHFNQNCLNYIKNLKKFYLFSLCTYYPMLGNNIRLMNMSNCKINSLEIFGYDKINNVNEKNSPAFIFEALTENLDYLYSLNMTDCVINKYFIDTLNKCINLKILKFTNIYGFSLVDFDKLNLPHLKTLEISDVYDFDDTMCYDIVKNCPKLNDLKITSSRSLYGTCFKDIDNLPHDQRLLRVHVYRTPAVMKCLKQEITVNNISITFGYNDSFYMFVSFLNDDMQLELRNKILNHISTLDLKSYSAHMKKYNMCFDNNFFSSLLNLHKLILLKIESFYPLVDYELLTLHTLNIKYLYLINDNICEIDRSCDILEKFSIFNPNYLTSIDLIKCKIDKTAILSINSFPNLISLTLESVVFTNHNHGYLKQLSVEKLYELAIINNDQFTDEECITIIYNNLNLTQLNLMKCRNITENCFIELKILGIIREKKLKINIHYTLAGFYCLVNQLDLSECNIEFEDYHVDGNLFYLEQLFAKYFRIITLPHHFINKFNIFYTLDLTKLHALDDLSFEFVSQLKNLKQIKMRTHYKNVLNRKEMIKNLIKLNISILTIIGDDDDNQSINSDCYDIIEGFQETKCLELEHLTLINCKISLELIEDIQRYPNLQTITISNVNNNYLNKILKYFNFHASPVYQMTINDRIIENNSESIKMLRSETVV